ncbi:hypothetical protein [Paenibacillus fonticola]|uniref:hypothetical protein n=1 Tax=Paenibacillus fonticola TaxID=379896 RepID=UPI0003713D64|nr:hypothetical protein [Paenibacillus fonticola]
MKYKFPLLLAALFIFLLGGCTGKSENDSVTLKDMTITKEGDKKTKVHYGMDRSDAEKILGSGEEIMKFMIKYDPGVTIMYRNDKVAGIVLDVNSSDIFRAHRLQIGMHRDKVKEIYGEVYIIDTAEYIDYAYDTNSKKFIDSEPDVKLTQEEMEDVYVISVIFDEEGLVNRILLLDQKMARYFM